MRTSSSFEKMNTGPHLDTRHQQSAYTVLRASVAVNHSPIHEIADANSQWNDAEGSDGPKIAIGLDLSDQAERQDEADGAADQQNTRAPGTRCLIQFRLHGNVHAAGNSGKTLFAPQLSNAVVRVQRAKGNTQRHDDRQQSDDISAHTLLLLFCMRRSWRHVLREPPAQQGTEEVC